MSYINICRAQSVEQAVFVVCVRVCVYVCMHVCCADMPPATRQVPTYRVH
jgi:hypothetical protein